VAYSGQLQVSLPDPHYWDSAYWGRAYWDFGALDAVTGMLRTGMRPIGMLAHWMRALGCLRTGMPPTGDAAPLGFGHLDSAMGLSSGLLRAPSRPIFGTWALSGF